MAKAKMKIILPLVVWIWFNALTTVQSYGGIGFGIKKEIFFLNLEDGYFGCQVNESTDVLQLFELSKLCDGHSNCFQGSDELSEKLKCTNDCQKEDGSNCHNGACLDGQCYCNDGFGGCNCQVPDENECKYRPCDVFSHCTNTLGSFSCTCYPGYRGDGFHCEDINECEDPAIASRCVENSWCCNLPAHFLCKCNAGFEGDGEVQCRDIDECANPHACGQNALCHNSPGNYTCVCPDGFVGNPYDGCTDFNECEHENACAPGALCTNTPGGKQCSCPPGYDGDAYTQGCHDVDECSRSNPCGRDALCSNQDGSFRCACPPGFIGDPMTGCTDIQCVSHSECAAQQACINGKCNNPCLVSNPCTSSQDCQVQNHQPVCVKVCQCQQHADCGHPNYQCDGCQCVLSEPKVSNNCLHCPPGVLCDPITGACNVGCTHNEECPITEACIGNACQRPCDVRNICAANAVCINTNHGSDCSCSEGYQGNGHVGCVPVIDYKPVCQYNEDCPPNKLCDRLNRICINPCFEDSCGDNAECLPKDHGTECKCLPGYEGNAYIECEQVYGCRDDAECQSSEACINGQCGSPCQCGLNATCEVIYHRATCKCAPGYIGSPEYGCQPPQNPCDPNPCGTYALCELDNGHPICFCPKGLTGNPFKACIPEGDECSPNPCGPNSGCRVVGGKAVCFCLPEYEGTPPQVPCDVPQNPCNPSPCGPNTQCSILSNGFAKCTCLPGYLESPNTIRGCVEQKNPCEPNPCGVDAQCDPLRQPVCFCPIGTIGNPFRSCAEPPRVVPLLCSPGPCGLNADCYVSNNQEQCYCRTGFVGNPYAGCRLEPRSPCLPNPCGPGAQCVITHDGQPMCRCPDGMGGDPTGPGGCHGYECVVDDSCQDHQACIGYRCRDPCPGSCGENADCRVEKHHPVCTCRHGLTGSPLHHCYAVIVPVVTDPCMPSPCGLNTICQNVNGRAVCSCYPDFQGDPHTGCQPECVLNSDCPLDKACLNRHCRNPCDSEGHLCGINALCQVRDHTATCICPPGFMGDALFQCLPTPVLVNESRPCNPDPCDVHNSCNNYGGQVAICDPCLRPDAAYNPQCRPECLTNSDCPFDKACFGTSCHDPCPGSCGVNAVCNAVSHVPVCLCPQGLVGNPFEHCSVPLKPEDRTETCQNLRCGANAYCEMQNKALSCICHEGFYGNPWVECRPECVINQDCPLMKACINNKCVDPCAGACGVGAKCDVINHSPICYCPPNCQGDPFVSCVPVTQPPVVTRPENPCDPSPCGPFSRCHASSQGYATCSCLPNYLGAPPACRPECTVSSECGQPHACVNQKCVDPCPGTCGLNALCTVINHNPICSCQPGQQGDPFTQCYTPIKEEEPRQPSNPCAPSPCGPNSICQVKENRPVCSCSANYIGSPPYCRPECVINQECPRDQACVKEKCINPCINSCGQNAKCDVVNHTPVCSCVEGFEGDAFIGCSRVIIETPRDPCNPSPCGINALCTVTNGAARCSCIPPYIGNPYAGGCQPECTSNSDCSSDLACVAQHCRNPCQGVCGHNAECTVVNHVPVCTCARGLIGDPFTSCREAPPPIPENPCEPSPCGPNSICRPRNQQAICSCAKGYFGTPPMCKPECVVSSECASNKACINQRCIDPCPGTCGLNARCVVNNHNPICSCPVNFVGDPFTKCEQEVRVAPKPVTHCIPSPCGPNAECRAQNDRAVCTCIAGTFGAPPNCRPECAINQDCPSHLACVNNKCKNPCVGSCGFNAECSVLNHRPTCSCRNGFEGDPFVGCNQIPVIEIPTNPCNPSPCGANALCREHNGAGACSCLPEYFGDPYAGCRPECVTNTDCSHDKACLGMKCRNPCAGSCGINAECTVINHNPQCYCLYGHTGNPLTLCHKIQPVVVEEPRRNPCIPSPCGAYSICQVLNDRPVCSCSPNYLGAPPNCRPECLVNSECSQDRACVNQKCIDPCPGTCGYNAHCKVILHSPICSCPHGYLGDPFSRCILEPPRPVVVEDVNPCVPSPCGAFSDCQRLGDRAKCTCLTNYFGQPPNCRPECVVNSECALTKSCVNQRCINPCRGSCGQNTECRVVNHQSLCLCVAGFTGDPFSGCQPFTPIEEPKHPCNPSPCGANAVCRELNVAGSCTCLTEYFGDPYAGCRPECVTNTDCPRDKACINNKCRDPCPGTCGLNADCRVYNHAPSCNCLPGYIGDPLRSCHLPQPTVEEPPSDPCQPSPCGPNAQCRMINNHAVCSCIQNYIGSPPSCRPECTISSECSLDKSCINLKCKDPCPGTCGINARCSVVNHNPICSCGAGLTGDPFTRCVAEERRPIPVPGNPCLPSPCGPNSQCREINSQPVCSCVQNYVGRPPNCRPECSTNDDCPNNLSCFNEKCRDPCVGSCGLNALCSVIKHSPICTCLVGFSGDPFVGCAVVVQEVPRENPMPCNPSPCGANAVCKERNGAGSCSCLPEYFGDPYTSCKPECVINSDCSRDKACVNMKCTDPCPGTCGLNAECRVSNHAPSCVCFAGYIGNPSVACHLPQPTVVEEERDPCRPSPCGPYSNCRNVNGHAVCSCKPNYISSPPSCRPECMISADCSLEKACIGQKCQDPCPGTCGVNALCHVVNHNPICSCSAGFTGDPFVRCIQEEKKYLPPPPEPCQPSPCGPNSVCRVIGNTPACSCVENYVGRPPNCRPECTINAECPSNLACQNERCKDPCPGSCGPNADCVVMQHRSVCTCRQSFTGDPFGGCSPIPPTRKPEITNPCNPNPCGANAICKERNGAGSCICIPEYFGDPYSGCRPECVTNSDCKRDKACANNKCKDPCPGTCGLNAECVVNNHAPSCNCLPGYTGNPLLSCHLPQPIVVEEEERDPCQPSPCGPYSNCKTINGHAVCSCQLNYIGTPPACRPECMVSSECPQNLACINNKCGDPCPGTCGLNARCSVVNHNPICSCPSGFIGDPFVRCIFEEKRPTPPPRAENPCVPSPCGPNSVCRVVGDQAACSCSPNFIGRPPNCRPECTINADCPSNLACQNEKCIDPCPGSCGSFATCITVKHTPQCHCVQGYTGDPFTACNIIPPTPVTERPRNPCNPSPCGANAVCRERNGAGSCACVPEYFGDPYTGCRPECVTNSDCDRSRACVNNKCTDPCPGTCGINAECRVLNHAPSCSCINGYTGDPIKLCFVIKPQEEPKFPCRPSPCGPNSQCREINTQAVCSCVQGYLGTPPMCRPECMVSSECPQNKACVNKKCVDPCPGTCGLNADCRVVNHNPICSCLSGFSGDPFTSCTRTVVTPPPPRKEVCVPSPCGPNSQCRVIGDQAACSCLPNYVGRPPNCRPECITDLECPNYLACKNERCKDPCPGTCGQNAQCTVVNHSPVCNCIPGYIGDPLVSCNLPPPPSTERIATPCSPSPCGPNAECRERNGAGSCTCRPGYEGNAYDARIGCKRECETNAECADHLACVAYKCKDPCPGTCGLNANCKVANHIPTCECITGFTGDPFLQCNQERVAPPQPKGNPCQPSPCGPNSQCREVNEQAVCSCLPNYIGSPPSCRPECVVSSECPLDRACVNQKCADPCPNTCGLGAQCTTKNHNPICACPPGHTGDPFTRCSPQPVEEEEPQTERPPSCIPSPCGPNSQCQIRGNSPTCSCLPNFIGSPPSCRPECVLSSECGSQLACINQKCRDPCAGSCGFNAKCFVLNHLPICTCEEGFTGDAFTQCHTIPVVTEAPLPKDPCNPSPCGSNAQCNNGICTCQQEYQGNPYESCRPECVQSTECSRDKACLKNKCRDPCPGTCGQNARCDVINHIPTCSCPDGFTGDPFTSCRVSQKPPEERKNPCQPSPCGPNSQCKNINDHAVCSCLEGYFGAPPSCKPECVTSTECASTRACVNQKCSDPCLGSCGVGARCEVINHSPICSCPQGMTGDPFQSCREVPRVVEPPPTPINPCDPSPCGPNSVCQTKGDSPSCTCLPNYFGSPPACRPECVINPDCPSNRACVNNRCVDPCPGSCGTNAECRVIGNTVSCSCSPGFTGNAFVQCVIQEQPTNPCEPSPCGANAECKQRNGAGACTCIQDYHGNPYEGCKPECVLSADCPTNKACIRNKCVDPCPGICGQNAECNVINHVPQCICVTGYTGDPFTTCTIPPPPPEATLTDPCEPSPCGPNAQCRVINEQAVCSCQPEYQGSPPNCRPECVVSSECPSNRACHKFKCANPCAGTCGLGAKCEVINHNPICSCPSGLTGDPFTRCYERPKETPPPPKAVPQPCRPSPCGPNSQCREIGEQASCSCLPNFMGSPPNCRPECVVNTDCASDLACITEKCRDPCLGSCGVNADCRVQNHIPICTCAQGFVGDPFTQCQPKPEEPRIPIPVDPCNPSPCGPNAQCNNGICTCLREYQGDPYRGCRPECTMNSDCSPTKACINQKCRDPCPGTCGQNAECNVVNHIPTCSCPLRFEGDPFTQCRAVVPSIPQNPCQPSPCGPNSLCRVNNGVAVCSCQPGLIGSPPSCRPECVVSAECSLTQACLNQKCIDPCPGTCGINAKCQVVNHNPICSCNPGHTGDPFTRCYIQQAEPPVVVNPCQPSPCGPNSVCQVRGESPACSCLESYVGVPPNCRPECTINPECPSHLACINQKCGDPCPGSCGANAECRVSNHNSICTCHVGYTGNPFQGCVLKPETPPPPPKEVNPCYPSPCGPNARCRVENKYAVCECIPEYFGNPYEACRPECLVNSDCPMNRACIRNKCQDPCPGTCGINALCSITNHIPICTCPEQFTGDAFRLCTQVIEEPPRDPCNPSPCGINTICRQSSGNAICECLPGFFGTPSSGGCKPECTISADCSRDRACVNSKCVDPCPGVCGYNAQCQTINHSPVCSCPTPLIGDPFTLCREAVEEPKDLCNPSPCRPNGQCRVVNDRATCIYPECVINQDCPRDKACYNQKCASPCTGACGLNALCQVVNHKAICNCPSGYIGQPESACRLQPKEEPLPKPECTHDQECANDKTCHNQQCQNPCAVHQGVCGQNAECRPILHRAVCYCREGYTGNAQSACLEIGCRADTDCPPIQACINRECVDPCSYTSCGLNALCRSDSNHKARCYCPNNFRGDALIRCERPECTTDDECSYNLACRNERCEDPCNCGYGAQCTVRNHRPQCSCPPGYIGNPLTSCNIAPVEVEPECKMDADCPSKLACFSGNCKNPCVETKPCGVNAECSVVDSLPLRTMACLCLPGYIGDADTECRKAPHEELGCASNSDCDLSETCLNRKCINPCVVGSPCAVTAFCNPQNHKAVCRCPSGLIGDPFIRCYKQEIGKPECTSHSDCTSDRACINQKCQDPCALGSPCGSNAQCRTSDHFPTCLCRDGWAGNPQVLCYKPECKSNDDCPYNKACINDNCLNPCSSQTCGRGAECLVQNHFAQCQCPQGTQGNPLLSCISGICQYNEDCADHEACDRLNRVCRPVCDDDTCAETALCKGINHQPQCSCPTGTFGNPFHECATPKQPQPECRSDSECSSQLACINQRCANPCSQGNMCTIDQECRVLDTLPQRTVICQCPQDTVADTRGRCKAIEREKPECQNDNDCRDSEKCLSGTCVEACKVDNCGVNALCNSLRHQAVCSCAPGYTGNPHLECSNVPKTPLPIPLPECYSDDQCSFDKSCINERCTNPCVEDKPCGTGAFCAVNNHVPVCTCPASYEGNPRIECIPPLGPRVGCKSNSQCAQSESCINQLCVSPCNCGPNAECKVTNHYPICFCQPGYSGNPQTGCVKLGCQSDNECASDLQCYNGQCINPCILGDPCARNAECYGSNHRATCRCPPGYEGNPLDRCERVECHKDTDCPNNRACIEQRCVDPCSEAARPPCAQNALCFAQNHAAGCVCPPHLPQGNPMAYCTAPALTEGPECTFDMDCPSKLACISNTCVNPCDKLTPCHRTAHCSVIDTVPVRTMTCTCPEGWVPNENGECHPVIIPIPPGCTSDSDCSSNEACINRVCRNPCDCGTNSECLVQNHRPICSCAQGYEGNPNIACRTIGCRIDSECESGKACINGNCINPCLVNDPCGTNAECYVYQNRAECRCASGYRGNPLDRCTIVGCQSNSDCPTDRQCINAQCINPCVYDNPCSPRAECRVQNHLALCRCPTGFLGNPYIDCRPEPQPECREDSDCPARLACLTNKCQNPCEVLEPCHRPSECQVVASVPVRTMICICPPGYISSGSGTCNPVAAVREVGACVSDSECPSDKACYNGICRDPCNCGPNAECRIKNHKPVCTCKQGYDGNPEIECSRVGCRSNSECSPQHTCLNRQCVPVCTTSSCALNATCYGINHRAICECQPGFVGNAKSSCTLVGCRSDTECPTNLACINSKCESPCRTDNPCGAPAECKVFNHAVECACPPGTVSDGKMGCMEVETKCRKDSDCPLQYACIGGECVNPCTATEPCGVNAECRVLDTEPVRTMVCECLPGYQGNAAVQCDKMALCDIAKGYIRTPDGKCECPPNTGLNDNDECVLCLPEKGMKIDERGRCVCALERGLIINERGECVCPTEFGWRLDTKGNCLPSVPECKIDDDCPDHKFCEQETKTCQDPCRETQCGVNAFCNATNHRGVCQCISGSYGDPKVHCNQTSTLRTDFPRPEMLVSCLSDGVQVEIHIAESGFNGVLYVKGHSKDEQCRRVVTMPPNSNPKTEIFKVQFGNCGLIHVNGQASFVLVIQKHPKLVTYKAQAYHIKCVYQTGEQNVTLGFNVSMLTTAGTIANTGPPPTCLMKIVTPTGQEINSAEIGDNLMLQVDVQPGSIYGGFARSCVAKTTEDNIENEYIVTDENGCATDPTIFGEWEYNPDTQSLLASFNAFKFPSSDNIRFQCNIRVCFGKCQPVNCRGYNAFGRRKRAVDENNTDVAVGGDLATGQLREEITIQSNAILTFERREERLSDPTAAADAQRVEDICVSMIGFIIALIITALLALVAVAVAVSCWLMAYRRRPKASGPLPHPPEFPNPLFTTPEPMTEPSPDYLT